MDSACDFDLLGESVPQVRVSARTLVLLGFFIVQSSLTPFFLVKADVLACWIRGNKHLTIGAPASHVRFVRF